MCTGNEAPQVSVEVLHGDVSTQPDVKDARVSENTQARSWAHLKLVDRSSPKGGHGSELSTPL